MSLSNDTTMLVQPAYGNYGGGGGMWNGNNDWWILLLFLFGWGRGGNWGNQGGSGDGYGSLSGIATRADINAGFQFNDLQNGIRGIQQGICDSTYALNNAITGGFHNMTVSTMNGFNGVQQSLCNLQHAMSDCCCTTQKAIDGVNFNMSKGLCDIGNMISMQTRDIVDNANANYRGLMDFLVQEKLSNKDAQIAQLQNKVALSDQSALFNAKIDASVAELLRRTGNDCPVGAYLVQPPTPINFPTNSCGTVQFGGHCGNAYGCVA